MDMGFSLADAAPLSTPSLDYPTLVAAIRADTSEASTSAFEPPLIIPSEVPTASLCLAMVLLGRPGWREAALALGGCFAPAAS